MQELFQLRMKLQKKLRFYFFGKMKDCQNNLVVDLPKLKTFYQVKFVRALDRKQVGSGSRGPLTARLQAEFRALVTGAKPDRHGWLTRA